MVLLSKFLILFILPILSLFPNVVSDKANDFKTKVNDYYDYYVLETYETVNYTFIVAEGICNEELTYALFFASLEANAYDIIINVNDSIYTLEEDSRGDTVAYVILQKDDETKICIFDNEEVNSTKRYEYILKYKSIDDIKNDSNVIKGNNLGTEEISKLKRFTNFGKSALQFVIILVSISFICILWLLYLYIFKKGIFNKTKERTNEVEFFIYEDDCEENLEVEVVEEEKVKEEAEKEVYEKKKYYFEEDEIDFDFSPYLKEKGYKEDYSTMTEEEKNQVMLLLMTLKHQGKISDNQYQKEVIKLWKK